MKDKKIIYVVKESLHMYPPCITQILMLNDLGVAVTVICGNCDKNILNLFGKKNIKCIIIGNKRMNIRFLGKVISYLMFRHNAWKVIQKEITEKSILWFGTADAAIALTGKYGEINYVLSVLELYDKYPFYQKGLQKIIGNASGVIACEENRARIMKSWWNLSRLPFIMPNKPYSHPKSLRLKPTSREIEEAILKIKQNKVILYQGIISADRDLKILAEALNDMKSDYLLVLMGKQFFDGVSNVQKIYDNTLYLGYFPAPLHLEITSYANIGIANYDDSSLNNLFCAPNKIYEYTGFGIPVLGSDVPGLKSTIGAFNAGECVDFSDKYSIIRAIEKIEINYASYEYNAKVFFNSIDNFITMKKILESI